MGAADKNACGTLKDNQVGICDLFKVFVRFPLLILDGSETDGRA